MKMRTTAMALISGAVLAAQPAAAQQRQIVRTEAPLAPAEPLGLIGGDGEISDWIGAVTPTDNGTITVWTWKYATSLHRDDHLQGTAFHDEINCTAGSYRRLSWEVHEEGVFRFGYAVTDPFSVPDAFFQESVLIPYICSGARPEVWVANPDEARAYFRR